MKSSFVDSFGVQVADLPASEWGKILAKFIRENETLTEHLESAPVSVSERGSEGKLREKAGSVASPIHLQIKNTTSPARIATEVSR